MHLPFEPVSMARKLLKFADAYSRDRPSADWALSGCKNTTATSFLASRLRKRVGLRVSSLAM